MDKGIMDNASRSKYIPENAEANDLKILSIIHCKIIHYKLSIASSIIKLSIIVTFAT
jgi:hypothetical protein